MLEGLRIKIACERVKLSAMSGKERREYVWDYYKVHFLVLVLFMALLAGIIWQLLFNNQKTVYNFAIINEVMDVERDKQLMEALSGAWALDPRRKKTTIDSNYNIPYIYDDATDQILYADGSPASDYTTYDKFFLNLSCGVVDAAVMPEGFLEYCNGLDQYFWNLEDILPGELLKTYAHRLCYATAPDGSSYPCGIYMDGTVFDAAYFAADAGTEAVKSFGCQVLVYAKTQKNKERNDAFLCFIINNFLLAE